VTTAAPHPFAFPSPRTWLVLSAALAVGLALRIPRLYDSVWFDEACMSDQRLGTFEQLVATIYVDIHPPLYIVFMHCWNALFGDGELALRLPPLLAGLAAIPLTFLAGRRLAGDVPALWAAVLLALSPVHVWYSAEARLYAPMVSCALLAVYSFHRLLDDETAPRWLLPLHLGNVAVMLALHYYLALYVLLLAALAPLLQRSRRGRVRRIVLWHGGGLALLGAFVVAKRALGEFATAQDYMRAMTPAELVELLLRWGCTGNTLRAGGWAPAVAAALVFELLAGALVLLGLFALWRHRRQRPAGLVLPLYVLAIPGFLLLSALLGLGNTYIERSCLPALPFLYLLVAAGLDLLPRPARRGAAALLLLLVCAALVALFGYRATHWTVYKPNPDWRAAARWLGAEIDAGAAGRPLFTSMPNPRPLPYYDPRIQDWKTLQPATDPAAIEAKVAARLGASCGRLAGDTFRRFDAHNAALLREARLLVYASTSDPHGLDLEHRLRPGDDTFYLVRNRWHPHVEVDGSIEDLLADPRCEQLAARHFAGIDVYTVRLRR
jgi:hypothetical protein